MPTITPHPASTKPLTEQAIKALAAKQVSDSLAAQNAVVEGQRKAAAARSAANQAALTGIGDAAQGILSGAGAGMQAGYAGAANQIASIAGGFSGAAADRVRAAQAANDAFAASQGQTAPSGQAPSATSLQDSLYGIGGYNPSASLAAQGAAANVYGQGLLGVNAAANREAVQAEQGRAAVEDAGYAQKLIDIAATQPALKQQALDALYQHELSKLQARLQLDQTAETKREFDTNLAHTQARDKVADSQWQQDFLQKQIESNRNYKLTADQWAEQLKKDGWEHDLALRGMSVQEAAQRLYERQFNEVTVPKTQAEIDATKAQTDIAYKTLDLNREKYDWSIQHAIDLGRQIDPSASRVYGKLVDQNNHPILDESGKEIPVAVTATSADKQNMFNKAVEKARTLSGVPMKTPAATISGAVGTNIGVYIARPGASGVFPADPANGIPATTNDPKKARTTGQYTFSKAQSIVMGEYRLTKAQARKALISAGWKPDGIRPAGK